MTRTIWRIFDNIGDLSATGNADDTARIGRMLDAAMETVSDVLPAADGSVLSDGAMAAAHALARIQLNSKDPVDKESADFLAGRLAAIVDILGFAASRTVDASDVEAAMREPYAGIVRALGEHGPQTLEDLAAAQDVLPEHLGELTKMGMTTQVMYGQEVRHVLTPAGVLLAEELAKGASAEDLLAGTLR